MEVCCRVTVGILIHEMGHYIAARRRGLKADLPIFMPGFGAYVRWYHSGVPLSVLSAIALAGPMYGLGVAAICWFVGWQLHAPLFLVLANTTAWINLANLIPVFGLDGAQATYALTRLQRVLVAATCLIFFGLTCTREPMGLMAFLDNPNNHIVLVVIAVTMLWRCMANDVPEDPDTGTLTLFIGLIIVLGAMVHMTGFQLMQVPELATRYRPH